MALRPQRRGRHLRDLDGVRPSGLVRICRPAVTLAGPEEQIDLGTVVNSTAELEVFGGGQSSCRARDDMVELQETTLAAAPAVGADERAASAVTDEDRPLHPRRDVRGVARASTRSRTLGQRELLLEQVVEEDVERPREDLGGIAVRDRVAHQVPDEIQLAGRLLGRSERDPVTVGRQRPDERRRCWREGDTFGVVRRSGRSVRQLRRRRRGRRYGPAHRGQLANGGRHVGHREPPRQQLLHLSLPLARGLREQPFVVVPRQVGREQADGGQVDSTRREQPKYRRIPPDHLGRLHAVVGLVLRKEQHAGAIREERREAGALVQPPTVQLGQVRDQGRGGLAFTPGETRDLDLELAIGEARWNRVRRHAHTSHAGDLRSRRLSPILFAHDDHGDHSLVEDTDRPGPSIRLTTNI